MRKVLITGADRGLGLALCKVFLDKGWEVFAGQYMPEWPELAALKNDALHCVPLDVASDESVDAALAAVAAQTDSLDIILNVAGIIAPAGKGGVFTDGSIFERPDSDAFAAIYNTNTLGPLRVCNRFVPLLLKTLGDKTVVNISSEAGSMTEQARRDTYAYCMSKAALNMQSYLLQNSLAEYGVKVLAVHPGWLRTYMSGSVNTEATVEADDSALALYTLIQEKRAIPGHMYYDYTGREMSY
jgi:NAD(P)-dependent dehydrogenase (short-subunit alcohol dehydrogenase family)